jgi:hypothetical protein
VAVKREWERVTRASLYAALVYWVVRSVEDAVEDPDPGRVRVRVSGDVGAEGSIVDVEVYGAGEGVGGEYELAGGRLVRVYPGEAWGGETLRSLMSSLPRAVWRLDGPEIRRLASETDEKGVEYMVIYFSNGSSVWLEGDVHRVTVPALRGAVAAVHTHPSDSCALSRPDVLSALDLLIDGGIFEAAATPRCMFYLVRLGLVTENDYIELLNVKGGIWEPRRMESVEVGVLF